MKNLTAILLATFISVAKATADDSSGVGVPRAITASSDTNKPGLVSVVAAAISAAAPNLRGADSFIAVSDGHEMEHGQEKQVVKEEDQEDIAVTGTEYYIFVGTYFHGVANTGTSCKVTAWFQFANKRRSFTVYGVNGKWYDTNMESGMKFTVFSGISDGAFQYVDLEIHCDDAMLVDFVDFYRGSKYLKAWGSYNTYGWCMSTNSDDGSSWKRPAELPGCYNVLRFDYSSNGDVSYPFLCKAYPYTLPCMTNYGECIGCNADTHYGNCCGSSWHDHKCGVGEGDCVKDDDCLEGLKCGFGKPGHHYNCLRDFGWGPPTFNCCYRPNVCVAQANLVCGSSCAAAASPTKCIGCDANAAKYSHDCCTKSNKCGIGEGDCDDDDDCQSGLMCGEGSGNDNNCLRDFGWGPAVYDCCYKPFSCAAATSPTECIGCDANAAKTKSNCCTDTNKCGVGEGDCDRDADCQSGLKCGQGSGKDDNCLRDFGWGFELWDYDCCYKP